MVELSSSNFVDEIDKEKPQVTIIIHLYENVSAVISLFGGKLDKKPFVNRGLLKLIA